MLAVPAMSSLLHLDYAPLLPEIQVPVVAINSSIGGPADEARIKKSLPAGFKAITIDKTDHFLMMDAADGFNPVLLQRGRRDRGGGIPDGFRRAESLSYLAGRRGSAGEGPAEKALVAGAVKTAKS